MKSGHHVRARGIARSVLGGIYLVWLASACGGASSDPGSLAEASQELRAGRGHGHHHQAGGEQNGGAGSAGCNAGTQDDLFQLINSDLARADAEDRPFQRYLSLANRAAVLGCGAGLDGERAALTKLINSLSVDASLTAPVPVDAHRTLFRLDLRDYGWDRSIAVGARRFADAWEALIAASPYALEYVGDDADDAKSDTGTAVPVLFGNAFVAAAARAPLYYALLDLPADVDDFFREELGIDNGSDELARAGFSAAVRTGEASFLAQRFEIQVRAGVAWQISEFDGLFSDPLGQADGERELVFSLPNGLQGHILADANGRLKDTSSVLADGLEGDGRAHIATSFFRSRANGVQLEDEVRDFARANPRNFDRAERAAIRSAYPRQQQLQQLLDADRQLFSAALERVGLDLGGAPEPISQSFADFEADVDLQAAAGDLLITPEDLRDNIDLLHPVLSVLAAGGKLDRDDFNQLYAGSACILGVVFNNQIDPVLCDEVVP